MSQRGQGLQEPVRKRPQQWPVCQNCGKRREPYLRGLCEACAVGRPEPAGGGPSLGKHGPAE